ncbi:EndoU domain-containing protein, partial [Andreprevotia sp. IGB-42]|uniref:EndoU domain-containing protein n=1 Tax=Andreprevotia sp. IGB-42 TaxID=2497473 RepID=UPI001F31F6E4
DGAESLVPNRVDSVAGVAPELVGPRMPVIHVSPEMQQKILWGQRQLRADGMPSNGLIGAHSGSISNDLENYAVQVLRNNPDGTSSVKLVTQFSDGIVSKIKTSTLYPKSWSELYIFDSIQVVGSPSNAIATRISDGSTLYQGAVNGINMEVIKIGNRVTSAYPTGGGFTSLETFGLTPLLPKP